MHPKPEQFSSWQRHGRWIIAAALSAAAALPAQAANHALILWIGEYADPRANLPGIELDAVAARKMASAMGVPAANISELKNAQLDLQGLNQAFKNLNARLQDGDKVFIYYSGHGGQKEAMAGSSKRCSEGLVASDVKMYDDRELEIALQTLQAKASQVVMMNDSCFSGGASLKAISPKTLGLYPKFFQAVSEANTKATDTPVACGEATNKQTLTKNFAVVPNQKARLLYIAAAADHEVSYATASGSLATQGWLKCLNDPKTDADRSGAVTGEELRQCAQKQIDGNKEGVTQHITLTGSSALPLFFGTGEEGKAANVNPYQTMRDLQAGADPTYRVTMQSAHSRLRIDQDFLDLTVEVSKPGYLYILQAGSDGKAFNLLFPNRMDPNNRVTRGTYRFPRDSWALRASGPAGRTHLLAVMSPAPRDFQQAMNQDGPFANVATTRSATKNLVLVATGADQGNGTYGTSEIITIEEAP